MTDIKKKTGKLTAFEWHSDKSEIQNPWDVQHG